MTMQIKITNEDQVRVGAIKHWENNELTVMQQLLPGESKTVYLHATHYITIEECEKANGKTTLNGRSDSLQEALPK